MAIQPEKPLTVPETVPASLGETAVERDMDLVRKILITLAEHPHGNAPAKLEVPGYDKETIDYHVFLMGENGGELLRTSVTTTMGSKSPSALGHGLTWKGHEFVDAARQETNWNRAKALVARAGSSAWPVWMEALTKVALERLSGP